MTREEAIDIIKCLAWHTRPNEEDIEQAIKALQQEPCEDAISRDAVFGLAYDMSEIDGEHFTEPCMVIDVADIQKLPSVKPQEPKWIPVSERLPQRGQVVLWCNEFGSVFTSAITYQDGDRYSVGRHIGDMIAWMPLPKPYDPQERSDQE